MTIGTKLYTFFCGKLVGQDEFGNRYYTEKKPSKSKRRKRWVMYSGHAEASKVPADWHGWLHYTHDELPASSNRSPKNWIKPHQPNLSGTSQAYLPPGHVLSNSKRAKATGDYQAWKPQ